MSEKKTAEIKFRIEPSVKAFWQAQAAVETEGNLSELIVKATNQHVQWARENARLAGGGVSASYEGLCDCAEQENTVCDACQGTPTEARAEADRIRVEESNLLATRRAAQAVPSTPWMFEWRQDG